MGVSFLGVLMISGVDLSISWLSFKGDVAAIISAALAAIYTMLGSKAQREIGTHSYTSICYFVCAITALPIALVIGVEVIHFEKNEWLILLGLIAGAQILGHSMFNATLKRVSPAIVSLIVFFEVPVATLLAIWWLDQRPPIALIPGIIVILTGCILVVLRTRPSEVMIYILTQIIAMAQILPMRSSTKLFHQVLQFLESPIMTLHPVGKMRSLHVEQISLLFSALKFHVSPKMMSQCTCWDFSSMVRMPRCRRCSKSLVIHAFRVCAA
jgi:uncharacterized membrane protein